MTAYEHAGYEHASLEHADLEHDGARAGDAGQRAGVPDCPQHGRSDVVRRGTYEARGQTTRRYQCTPLGNAAGPGGTPSGAGARHTFSETAAGSSPANAGRWRGTRIPEVVDALCALGAGASYAEASALLGSESGRNAWKRAAGVLEAFAPALRADWALSSKGRPSPALAAVGPIPVTQAGAGPLYLFAVARLAGAQTQVDVLRLGASPRTSGLVACLREWERLFGLLPRDVRACEGAYDELAATIEAHDGQYPRWLRPAHESGAARRRLDFDHASEQAESMSAFILGRTSGLGNYARTSHLLDLRVLHCNGYLHDKGRVREVVEQHCRDGHGWLPRTRERQDPGRYRSLRDPDTAYEAAGGF